jgi:tetratricopeptide (TPR) repeat protein
MVRSRLVCVQCQLGELVILNQGKPGEHGRQDNATECSSISFLAALIASGLDAQAASQELWNSCTGTSKNADAEIEACTQILAGQESLRYQAIALSNRGLAHNNKGDYERAIADMTRAIGVDPSYTIAIGNRGFVYNNKGDYDRAIADLTRAIELDPKDAFAFYNRSFAYGGKGDYDHAIADARLSFSRITPAENRGRSPAWSESSCRR